MYHPIQKVESKAIATPVGGIKHKRRLTNDHPEIIYGQPIFVDDLGQAYRWGEIAGVSTASVGNDQIIIDSEARESHDNDEKGGLNK
jgi:hypothetical protein